jgi:hypothetical protein
MKDFTHKDFVFYAALLFIAVSIQTASCSVRMGLKEVAEQVKGVR